MNDSTVMFVFSLIAVCSEVYFMSRVEECSAREENATTRMIPQ
jgi:hypothetical protein